MGGGDQLEFVSESGVGGCFGRRVRVVGCILCCDGDQLESASVSASVSEAVKGSGGICPRGWTPCNQ